METLLERGAEGDLAEAQEAIDRLTNLRADHDSAMLDITLLRLRTLLARARGDDAAYRDFGNRYRAMAQSLGFEGHIAWAEAMLEGWGIAGQECIDAIDSIGCGCRVASCAFRSRAGCPPPSRHRCERGIDWWAELTAAGG